MHTSLLQKDVVGLRNSARFLALNAKVDEPLQYRQIQGFEHIGERPEAHGLFGKLFLTLPGHDDHAGVGSLLLDLFQKFGAADAEIEKDQADIRKLVQGVQAYPGPVGPADLIAAARKELRQQTNDRVFVIYNQKAGRLNHFVILSIETRVIAARRWSAGA